MLLCYHRLQTAALQPCQCPSWIKGSSVLAMWHIISSNVSDSSLLSDSCVSGGALDLEENK